MHAAEPPPPALRLAQPPPVGQGDQPARAPLIIDAQELSWSALQPVLAEAAGGGVIQELVLDQRLRRAMAARKLTLPADSVQKERELLMRGLQASAGGAEIDEVLLALRRGQGLGEARFGALLERTAMLRLLVQDEVRVNDAAIAQAYALRHGPRCRVRLIVLPTQEAAAALRAELASEEKDLPARFSRAAIERSTHESAPRGGVLAPFSPEDPAYPAVLRRAAVEVREGQLSPVLALDRGFALLLSEGQRPGSGRALAEVREELAADVRLRQERLLMDRLANELLENGAGVIVNDRGLNFGWQALRAAPAR
jgi:hypothetical protein